MAKTTVEHQEEYPTLPDESIVVLKIEGCEVKEVQGRNGTWDKLEVTFRLQGVQAVGDGGNPDNYSKLIDEKIWGSVPFKLTDSPENRLRGWAEAILQTELPLGFELDTDFFDGRLVRGITNTYEKRSINQRTGKPFVAHQIRDLLPMGGNFTAPAPVTSDPWAQPAGQATAANDPWASPAPSEAAQQFAQAPLDERVAQAAQPPAQQPQQQPQTVPADPWAGAPEDEPPF